MIVKPEDIQIMYHWSFGPMWYTGNINDHKSETFEITDCEAKLMIIKDMGYTTPEELIDESWEKNR